MIEMESQSKLLKGNIAQFAKKYDWIINYLPDYAALLKYILACAAMYSTFIAPLMLSCTEAGGVSASYIEFGCKPSLHLQGSRKWFAVAVSFQAVLFVLAIYLKHKMLFIKSAGLVTKVRKKNAQGTC
jgi:hypothetical protein